MTWGKNGEQGTRKKHGASRRVGSNENLIMGKVKMLHFIRNHPETFAIPLNSKP